MIYLKIRNDDESITIGIVVNYEDSSLRDRVIDNNWKNQLLPYIDSNKKIIFSINRFDNDGFISKILIYWLKYSNSNKVFVKTREPYVKDILENLHADFIEFV